MDEEIDYFDAWELIMEKDVTKEFAVDLMSAAPLGMEDALDLARWLESEGYVDYDTLKEIYLYDNE